MTAAEYQALIRELTDKGKLIAVGFVALQFTAMPNDASPLQVKEMRMAFFVGAQHLFSSLIGMTEPGHEMTENDERRMGLIDAEFAGCH